MTVSGTNRVSAARFALELLAVNRFFQVSTRRRDQHLFVLALYGASVLTLGRKRYKSLGSLLNSISSKTKNMYGKISTNNTSHTWPVIKPHYGTDPFTSTAQYIRCVHVIYLNINNNMSHQCD